MLKRSSRSDKAISPSTEVIRQTRNKRILVAAILVVFGIGLYFYLHPKRLAVEAITPAGALVFVRLDHVDEHLKSLRSSQFWQSASKINVPRFLEHENVSPQKINQYNKRRSNIVGVLDSPVFKQYFGREVAVALYPQLDHFSNGTWPEAFSGILLIARLNSKTRMAQSLINVWNQYGQEGNIQVTHYKKVAITVVKLKKPDPTVYYATIGDVLVAAVDERIVHAAIDVVKGEGESIEKDARFLLVRKHMYDFPDGIFFIDVPRTKDFIQRYWDTLFAQQKDKQASALTGSFLSVDSSNVKVINRQKQNRQGTSLTQEKVQELLSNIDGLDANGGAFLVGKPIRSKWALTFDPAKINPELKRLSGCAASNNPTIQFVAKDAVLYQWMNCFDFLTHYEKLMALHQKKSGQDAASPFAGLEQTWGLSVKDDILPILGQELGGYVQGIEVGGLFPVPKFVFFLKVKDEKAAGMILKKIVTTPLTILQAEDYKQFKINFVSIPLMSSLRPSYAFLNGYLLIATSDELIKQSIDVMEDQALGLASQALYKEMNGAGEKPVNAVSFVKIGEIARQSRTLVDWADNWFSSKIQQANSDEEAIRQKWQALKDKVQAKQQELTAAQEQLSQLQKEAESLQSQAQASAVVSETKDTLFQQGQVKQPVLPTENQPQQAFELKKSQVEAAQSGVFGVQKDIEFLKTQQPDLEDAIDDFEKQKVDAQNFRYYVDEVVAPVLRGLESLTAQSMVTTFKDGVVESEIFLKAQ